jgi:hypothetical protein
MALIIPAPRDSVARAAWGTALPSCPAIHSAFVDDRNTLIRRTIGEEQNYSNKQSEITCERTAIGMGREGGVGAKSGAAAGGGLPAFIAPTGTELPLDIVEKKKEKRMRRAQSQTLSKSRLSKKHTT